MVLRVRLLQSLVAPQCKGCRRKLSWIFVVVNGFPESQPEIEHSQTACQPAHKSVAYEVSQRRPGEQQGIIGPLVGPGQDDQQNAESRAHRHEQQGPNARKPDFQPGCLPGWIFR